MNDLGIVKPGTTLYIPFHTFDSNDPSASVTVTDFVAGDVEIYKDGGTTQRASDAGYTVTVDFDSATGIHLVQIDLSDNTTGNFYEAGSQYTVVVGPITVDAATVRFVLATFTIGYPDAILNTTIATLASQTSFTLEEGPGDDDALNGCVCLVHDLASDVQIAIGYVSDYTGSTRTVTLAADPGIFTMAAGDNASFFVPANVAAVGGTSQTAGDVVADTEAVLSDTEANVGVLTDTEAILTDSEAVLADTEANVGVLTDTEAILADTNELQGDWTNTGRLDTILDAILTDTEANVGVLTDTEAILTDSEAILTDTENNVGVLADTEAIILDTEGILSDTETTLLTDTEAILSDTEGLSSSGLTPLASGTAQGGTASTIQLAASETFADDELNGNIVKITSGTGAGQSRVIIDYANSTDTATVTPNWTTNPSSDSVYEVVEGSANLTAVGLTAQTAGDIVADTEAILVDTEALDTATILTDTEAILTDSEAIITDTEAVLTDTESVLTDSEAILADTNELQGDWTNAGRLDAILDAVLVDTEANVGVLTDTEAILTDSEAIILDTENIVVDTETTLLTDTEAILSDTEGLSSSGLTPLASGTAQGGTASTIQLAAAETFADDELNGNVVKITSGTGAGQSRVIIDYANATDTATVTPNWTTNPSSDSVYEVVEGSANLVSVVLTAQTAGDIVSDTEAILTDSEAILTDSEAVLTDTEANVGVITDTEAILADTEANVGVITDTEAILTDTEALDTATILTDTEAILTDSEAIILDTENIVTDTETTLLSDTEAILSDTEGLSASGLTPLASGTAQAGTASTIQLAAAETFADDELNGNIVKITSGTGAGQSRVIIDYANSTDTATVTPNWTTNPDSTSVYEVVEGSSNLTAVGLTAQTAGDVVSDTEAILSDTEGLDTGSILTDTEAIRTDTGDISTVLTDTEAILTDTGTTLLADTEAILADTNELQTDNIPGTLSTILTDTEAVLVDTEAIDTTGILTDTEAILTDSEAILTDTETTLLTDTEAILSDSEAILTDTGTTLLADTEALLTDTEAVLTDSEAVLSDSEAILSDTEALPSAGDILTTQMTESYASDGSAPTLAQSLMMIQQMLGDFSISGTTLTVRQLDGSTTAATFTLDDSSAPTDITRSS